MSIMTIKTTITRKYLLGKSKSDLAYMYLELLERAVNAEADARALAEIARDARYAFGQPPTDDEASLIKKYLDGAK